MRRTLMILLLATVAVAMMGAEDPGCDKGGKGRQPQSAEHDPKALNPKYSTKPSDKTYRFRVRFDTQPTQLVRYTHSFGGRSQSGEWDAEATYSTETRVSPGEVVRLHVTGDRKTILQCYILYVPDKTPKQTRIRAHYIDDRAPYDCNVKWTVTDHEEDIPSLG